jgi:hypothetical protein
MAAAKALPARQRNGWNIGVSMRSTVHSHPGLQTSVFDSLGLRKAGVEAPQSLWA